MKKVKATLPLSEYNKLLEIIQELNKTSDIHKVKWFKDTILFYSLLTEKDNPKVNAVKVFNINRNELFSDLPEDISFSFIIGQGKEWYKKFKFLSEENENVEITFSYNEDTNVVYTFEAKNSILEISAISGDERIIKDMPMHFIKEKMNPNVADWDVTISDEMFKKIKKISKLDSSDLLTIKTDNSVVSFKDTSWEMKIGEIKTKDDKIFFDKSFLDMVTVSPTLKLCIFSTYIVVQEKDSLLMFNLSLFA